LPFEVVEEAAELVAWNEAEPTGFSGSFVQAIAHDRVLAVQERPVHGRWRDAFVGGEVGRLDCFAGELNRVGENSSNMVGCADDFDLHLRELVERCTQNSMNDAPWISWRLG
jgi:hypothetical protein